MHHVLSDGSRAVAARLHVVTGETLSRLGRHARSVDDERGSQTAEYAMVGGVGAAACATAVTIVREEGGVLDRVFETVLNAAVSAIGSWF